jgi:hypothetical protein
MIDMLILIAAWRIWRAGSGRRETKAAKKS